MNSGVSLLAKTAFSMTSQLRRHFVVSCKYWWGILQFFSQRIIRMIHAKNYEKLSKSVKVTAKILLVLFFRTQCSIRTLRNGRRHSGPFCSTTTLNNNIQEHIFNYVTWLYCKASHMLYGIIMSVRPFFTLMYNVSRGLHTPRLRHDYTSLFWRFVD